MKAQKSNLFKLLAIISLLNIYHTIYGQEKKTISEERIKSQVIWREGKKEKYKFQELRFDRSGNRTEEIKYNAKGKIVFHKAYEFTGDNLKREIELDSKGHIIQRIDYSYLHNVLVEKKTFDEKGVLILNEQYIYEYQN
jgi:hypothetical protein